ncbi:major facilitator transporter [Calothrix parasitica NIES-267]|uniref:Major facilitator transporter n=1 Tax=Calothrix parasitica NIES-267 TaxID=1973488 RepID=A0A1Z4M1M5_9CYAN|nr:major facilitator transporter [Calothrix parasitica NIES-267]
MANGKQVLWLQVCGLGMVQGAITLSWVIYNFYLPKLLVQFGFSKSLAISLLILENALAVFMEPLMGSLSDTKQRWAASRFPFIMVGVLLSSGLFIAIPCVVTFVPPTTVFKFILPPLVVAWALAMTVFRSPVLSLLGRYAMPKSLPMAVSVLTLIGGVIGSFRIAANDLLLSFGPVVTFGFGSFVLLGSALVLRFIHPPQVVSNEPVDKHQAESPPPISFPALGIIFVLGGSFAWGYRLLLDGVSKFLKLQLNSDNIQPQMVAFGLLAAIAALAAGLIAKKVGNRKAMLGGTGVVVLLMLLLPLVGANIILLATLAISSSFILNGTIPFALEMVPPDRGGLGIGMYFGGVGLAMSIFGSIFNKPQTISPQFAALMSAIAFGLFFGCVVSSNFIQRKPKI